MNRLPISERAKILGMMAEGNSLRSISRMADVSINTITKLVVDVGAPCSGYLDEHLVNLPCQRVQVDEIWAFCYAKAKNVTPEIRAKNPYAGDVWTWMAIDADTKLIPSWIIGPRDSVSARIFVNDLASRLANRIQLTSDGLGAYLSAVEKAFHGHVDYAQLQKIYGNDPEAEKRYSPAQCIGCERKVIDGDPDPAHVSTSYIERANLTARMGMRRFTRLTNGFSKKIENHSASVAIHVMHYNYARIHKTLRVTPAMAAGVSDHVWELEEIANLSN
jgi:IS1 family transposase/lambda repressor-like predicted transcriptional regulator